MSRATIPILPPPLKRIEAPVSPSPALPKPKSALGGFMFEDVLLGLLDGQRCMEVYGGEMETLQLAREVYKEEKTSALKR